MCVHSEKVPCGIAAATIFSVSPSYSFYVYIQILDTVKIASQTFWSKHPQNLLVKALS